MQENWRQVLHLTDQSLIFRRAKVTQDGDLTVLFHYAQLPDEKMQMQIEKKLQKQFPALQVQVQLSCPLPEVGRIEGEERDYLLRQIKKALPADASFLKDAIFFRKEGEIKIDVPSSVYLEMLKAHAFASSSSRLFFTLYGEKLSVTLGRIEKEALPEKKAEASLVQPSVSSAAPQDAGNTAPWDEIQASQDTAPWDEMQASMQDALPWDGMEAPMQEAAPWDEMEAALKDTNPWEGIEVPQGTASLLPSWEEDTTEKEAVLGQEGFFASAQQALPEKAYFKPAPFVSLEDAVVQESLPAMANAPAAASFLEETENSSVLEESVVLEGSSFMPDRFPLGNSSMTEKEAVPEIPIGSQSAASAAPNPKKADLTEKPEKKEKAARKTDKNAVEMSDDPYSQEKALIASILSRESKEDKKQAKKVFFGKTIHGEKEPISSLTDGSGRVIIEGVLMQCEQKELKGGSKLVLLSVTDYTSSVLCKVFLRQGKTMEVEALKEGQRLRLRGDCSVDTYSKEKELNLLVNDIMLLPDEKRTDEREEKRVELHLHTQMSTMDAVTGVDTLIRRAADWGQEAIAITDHGVVQAFPLAFDTVKGLKKKGKEIKLIPGMEGYLVNDDAAIVKNDDTLPLLAHTYVVLDVETTGLDPQKDEITEIAAVKYVNGLETETFTTLVNPQRPIPDVVVRLTGITDEMVRDHPTIEQIMPQFAAFLENTVLCAHNASFDTAFLAQAAQRVKQSIPDTVVDTLALSRALLPNLKSFKLNLVCKALGVNLEKHHRALSDTRATGEMFLKLLSLADEKDAHTLRDLNEKLGTKAAKSAESYHIVLLAQNQKGMENLYRLISESHLNYFNHTRHRPQIPRSVLRKYREGLILGSACEAGELFRAMVNGKSEKELLAIADFYDYLEIQPIGNNAFMVRNGQAKDEEVLRSYVKRIVALGKKLQKPVAATCDVHFMDPQDGIFRAILEDGMGFEDADMQPPLYFRTTQEMLDEFAFLGEEEAYQVVVKATREIASRVENITMFPKHPRDEETFQPTLPGAEEAIRTLSYENAHRIYGDPLPEIVEKRLQRELGDILGNGFGTLYYSAHLLVKKSNLDGYLVGSRGSVGSSLVATMTNITEVNPLPPHYVCPNCQFSDFDVDKAYICGVDLPERACPRCGTPLRHDGHDIPFEVFLGFNGDKVPDIDLNFSGVYQPVAHKYVEELYGKESVFRAGTIGTLAEKTAYGYVMKYLEKHGLVAPRVETDRLTRGVSGVKRTTGQHPGGMVVVPKEYSVYQFSPIQHPADDPNTSIVTTHYEFGSLHDILVKLDILGHDDPTMIHMLERLTGVKAASLPLNDAKVMSLFLNPDALGVTKEEINCPTGTLGIPEFGTQFVRQMLVDTQPKTVAELVRISGLSHGTNVWLNNAQDLIASGQATLMQCFCTRDDIMNYLITMGVEPKTAFFTMESVRKGRKLTPDMEKAMKEKDVPQYYIDSCNKIGYMFPRGHAVAYVTMALRVAWFKVYRPLAYYASYFTVRADEFDVVLMCQEPPQLLQAMEAIRALGKNATARDERTMVLLEIVYEMRMRGFSFLPLDLYKSSVSEFLIEEGKIRPPINRLPNVGQSAAEAIGKAREDGPFLSVEDLRLRSHISSATIALLRSLGALQGLQETSQVSFFSLLDEM